MHCNKWRRSSTLVWYLRVTEGETRRSIHRLVQLRQFCVRFIALWSQNGICQTPQSCQFFNRSLFGSLPAVMNLWLWLKKYYLKCKRQKWGFCDESTVWHLATKCAALKLGKPWMSMDLSSESKVPSYVGSTMFGMPHERLARQVHLAAPTGNRSSKDRVEWLHLRRCLVLSWCGASRITWSCCWPCGISNPPGSAVPATLTSHNCRIVNCLIVNCRINVFKRIWGISGKIFLALKTKTRSWQIFVA